MIVWETKERKKKIRVSATFRVSHDLKHLSRVAKLRREPQGA